MQSVSSAFLAAVAAMGRARDPKGCLCQGCGTRYRVDLLIPNALWSRIGMPTDGSGLLCGQCIMRRVEGLGEFGALLAADLGNT